MARRRQPVLGRDYIVDDRGRAEFTSEFLLSRGYCCELGCRYCPFFPTAPLSATQPKPNPGTSTPDPLTAASSR
jgi:hypothetical protein